MAHGNTIGVGDPSIFDGFGFLNQISNIFFIPRVKADPRPVG